MMESIEKHSIKISLAIVATIIIFLIATSFGLAEWKSNVEYKLNEVNENQITIQELERDNVEIKIQLATIVEKIDNIEVIVTEIKNNI